MIFCTIFDTECHSQHFGISAAELVIGVLDMSFTLLLEITGMFDTNHSNAVVKLKGSFVSSAHKNTLLSFPFSVLF